MERTCAFNRLHTGAYCANDHDGRFFKKGLDEIECAAACAKVASCSAFEFGCSGASPPGPQINISALVFCMSWSRYAKFESRLM